MAINITDSLNAATTKGKLGDAKQVFLNGDTKSLQQAHEETNAHLDTLDNRSTQMENAIKDISVTGGASTASAVSYGNSTSGLEAVTAQGAIDEVYSKVNTSMESANAALEKSISDNKTAVDASIQDVYKKSNYNDGDNIIDFNTIHIITDNPEFIKAIVDAEDRLLFGIQLDGSIEWGKGIPSPIRAKLQEIINQCQQDKTDILETINATKNELSASINALQEGKVDKEEGKSLIEDEVKECFRVIENKEFIKAITDAEDKVLFGFYRATGKPYYPLNEMYHVEQNEEYFAAWLDADDKIVLGIRRDGEIIGEIHAVNALKQVITQLQADLVALQEKVGIIDNTNLKELLDLKANVDEVKATNDDIYKKSNPNDEEGNVVDTNTIVSIENNPEYIKVEVDDEGKLLEALTKNGIKNFFCDVEIFGDLKILGNINGKIDNTKQFILPPSNWFEQSRKAFNNSPSSKNTIKSNDIENFPCVIYIDNLNRILYDNK